jgi:hypothetical protein
VQVRQSYLRVAKHAAMMAGRYAHAKQFNRYQRQLRLLRTRLCADQRTPTGEATFSRTAMHSERLPSTLNFRAVASVSSTLCAASLCALATESRVG